MSINTDVQFTVGDTIVLIINTDQPTGIFESELAAYVAGAYEGDGDGKEQYEDFVLDSKNDNTRTLSNIEDKTMYLDVSVYGGIPTSHVNWPTDNSEAEYRSVAIFLTEKLTQDEIAVIAERSKKFCGLYGLDNPRRDKITILDVHQVVVKYTNPQIIPI